MRLNWLFISNGEFIGINQMKKTLSILLLTTVFLSSAVFAKTKKVTICSTYFVGTTAEMSCSGGYNGKTNFISLYEKSWSYVGDISGTNKFMLIFEK